jgi:hypothetical protein
VSIEGGFILLGDFVVGAAAVEAAAAVGGGGVGEVLFGNFVVVVVAAAAAVVVVVVAVVVVVVAGEEEGAKNFLLPTMGVVEGCVDGGPDIIPMLLDVMVLLVLTFTVTADAGLESRRIMNGGGGGSDTVREGAEGGPAVEEDDKGPAERTRDGCLMKAGMEGGGAIFGGGANFRTGENGTEMGGGGRGSVIERGGGSTVVFRF